MVRGDGSGSREKSDARASRDSDARAHRRVPSRIALVAIALSTCASKTKPIEPIEPVSPPLERRVEIDAGAGAALLSPPIDGMAYLVGGTFRMGSTLDEARLATRQCAREPLGAFCRGFADELRPHAVTLSPFWLDRTEVTLGAYRRCVDAGACPRAAIPPGDPRALRDELPVTYVSFHDAEQYCAFRRARLPTEAEWERAARGRVGRRYPWGELPNPHLANHGALDFGARFLVNPVTKDVFVVEGTPDDVDGFEGLAPVGSFATYATPEGISDLAGNVAEWVADAWELVDDDATDPEPEVPQKVGYSSKPATNPRKDTVAAGKPLLRVVRGGSYLSPMAELRGAARSQAYPSERRRDVGFRCARDAR